MTSIFKYAASQPDESFEEIAPIFHEVKNHSKKNIIPPIGIADPELITSFLENIENEEKILQSIAEVERYKRETLPETALRKGISHPVRAFEGFLGGITSFMNAMIPPQTFEDETGETETFQGVKLPGAEELHEMAVKKHGKYIEPKSEEEKATHEMASDIGSMFSTPGLSALQKILIPVLGQGTKQIIKSVGGTEFQQDLGKLAFMNISTIAQLGNAPRVAAQAMQQVRDMIPQGVRFIATPTQRAFQRIRNTPWYRTGRTTNKGPAFDELDRVERAIQGGSIDAHEAMQLRIDINEARKKLGMFSFEQVPDKAAARRYLNEVDDALLASMENYGTNVNPQWWNQYQRANAAYAVTQRSRAISDFIEQHARPLKSDLAKGLFHFAGAGTIAHFPALMITGVPIAGGAKIVQLANRMIHSPLLRTHYANVLRAAAQGNIAVMQKHLEEFDKIAQKEEMKLRKNQGQ